MNITFLNNTNDTTKSFSNATWMTTLANTNHFRSQISTRPLAYLSNYRTTNSNLLERLKLINNTKIFNHTSPFKNSLRYNLKHLCNCERSIPLSNKIYAQNENIWKLAFFALAFIVGLVSMMLILTFSTKILL